MMGVHAGWFAKPKTGDQYTTDFRTEQSEAFYEYFQINTNPIGLINRLEFNGSRQVTHTSWEEKILAIQDEEADLSMEIESSYDENSNEVSININTTFFNDLPEDYNLIVSFVEDSVIDWQKWYGNTPEDVENYVHRHVLRDNINDLWGDPIDPTLTTTGTEHTFQYSYAPNTDWNLKKSYIVAYVYNTSTNEVLQVAEAHADEH